jgi:hypothetical protein
MGAFMRDPLAEAMLGLEIFEARPHVAHHRLVALRRDVAPAVALGESDDADRQRGPGRDAGLHVDPVVQRAPPGTPEPGEVEPDQLRAAAPDIEDKRPIAVAVDQRGAARHGELGLGLLAHDLDGKAGLAAHALDELAAVRGDAAGFSRDQPRPRHRPPAHLLGADFQRVDGAAHGGLRKPAGAQHAFAETDDTGERVDDEEAAARRLGDQEPAIVGAKIESAVNGRCKGRSRARVVLALGCLQEAIGRRINPRLDCDLHRPPACRAVAGLAPHAVPVTRSHGSRAGIAARPIHGVQPLSPRAALTFRPWSAAGALVL